MAEKLYQCNNEDCVLGASGQPGYFTGGMSQDAKSIKTGTAADELVEGEDYGEGVCPECGQKGEDTGETHELLVGEDDAK